MSDLTTRLVAGAAQLGVALDTQQVAKFETLVSELKRWNKAYSLTSITADEGILTHHLLDSLSVQADLQGLAVTDIGTGAGFPGLPLAIVNPGRSFVLVDAVDKKLRFINHVAGLLALGNVSTKHARVEDLRPAQPFDTVVTRAFAPLSRMLPQIQALCGPQSAVLAMKGRWPPAPDTDDAAAIPVGWQLEAVRPVTVPGLGEARHIVHLRWRGDAAPLATTGKIP
jgi:16S rRNA (guanine527-N7)-methyltransferase